MSSAEGRVRETEELTGDSERLPPSSMELREQKMEKRIFSNFPEFMATGFQIEGTKQVPSLT